MRGQQVADEPHRAPACGEQLLDVEDRRRRRPDVGRSASPAGVPAPAEGDAGPGVPAAQLGRAVGVVGEEEVGDRVPAGVRAARRGAPRSRASTRAAWARRALRHSCSPDLTDRRAPPRGPRVRGRVGSLVPCASRDTPQVRTRPTASSRGDPGHELVAEIQGDPLLPAGASPTGVAGAAGGRAAAGAGDPAQQGGRHRQELRRPRRRDGRRGAGRAADVPQAQHLGRRPRRPGRAARARPPRCTTRASSPSSSAGSASDVPRRAGRGRHLRLHRRQRRHRPRPAARRRAVGPGQGLRHVLPARAVDRDRPRRRPTCAGHHPPSTASSCRTARTSRHGPRRRRPWSPTSPRS